LGGAQVSIEGRDDFQRQPGAVVALGDKLLQPRAADLDQRKLGDDEEGVQQYEQ
jgi:hypothetical protein